MKLLWRRTVNRFWDVAGLAAGYCMATTWRPTAATYAPGWKHWRCWKARGHTGWHRTNNYRWQTGDAVLFDPLPVNLLRDGAPGAMPRWARGRHHLVAPRRRDRATARMVAEQVRNRFANKRKRVEQ